MNSYRGPREEYKIFAERPAKAVDRKGIRQYEVSDACDFSASMMSAYLKAKSMPESDRLYRIANFLDVSPAWLLGANVNIDGSAVTEDPFDENDHYYLNEETRKVAQRAYEDPEFRLLFDAYENASPEGLEALMAMVRALKAKEYNEDD